MLRERDLEKENSEAERLELMHSLREEGKTLQEIADMLGYKSRSTVMNMLKRAE